MIYAILFSLTLLLTITFILGFFASYRFASKFKEGLLIYFFYILAIGSALSLFLGTRVLGLEKEVSFSAELGRGFLSSTVMKLVFLIIALAVFERAINFIQHQKLDFSRVLLLFILVFLWVGNIALPSYVAAIDGFHLTYLMSLIVMVGIALNGHIDMQKLVFHTRNALLLFIVISFLSILIKPTTVLNFAYTNGYIPGLPRFYGLANHATVMASVSAFAIWLLIVSPFNSKQITRFFLFVSLLSLVLTQAKAVIFSFLVGLILIYAYKNKVEQSNNYSNGQEINPIILTSGLMALFSSAIAVVILMFFDISGWIYKNISLETIYKITTLTGRDIIWEYAFAQYLKYPLFGYGIDFLDIEHRMSLNMPFATHAHNQLIDSAARAGSIGLIGYALLYAYLIIYALKLRKVTQGLSLALISYILIFSMTAVPLDLKTLTLESIPLYFLLFIIASSFKKQKK